MQEIEAQYESSQSDEEIEIDDADQVEIDEMDVEVDNLSDELDSDELELYCPACKKSFKTVKA